MTGSRNGRARLAACSIFALILVATACSSTPDDLMVAAAGGEGTTTASNQEAFGMSARNLSDAERRDFVIGNSFFTQNWVTAPSSTDARDGLGPLLNGQACASCHVRDGRGTPEAGEPGLLFRLSVPDDSGPVPEPVYGDQLQDRSILGVPAEGQVLRLYVEESGVFADGETYSLRRPVYDFDDLAYGPISVEVQVSPRMAPAVFGAGLLEAIPQEDIVGAADPEDSDGDGISGRPNWIKDPITGEAALGRFGWKANVTSVERQVAGAFSGDIGITSHISPDQNCTATQTACAAAPNGGEPEIPDDRMDKVVFYGQTLAVPARRDLDSPDVGAGARLFNDIGCAGCHQPRQETGDAEIDALATQVIFPFTDLLLHDMGPGLADDRTDGQASGNEWRTAPLWGIGLTEVVSGHTFFLHDGRARSLEEAILWHGGEAERSATGFKSLSTQQRSQLIAFLGSL